MTDRIKRGETLALPKTRVDAAGAAVALPSLVTAAVRTRTFYQAIGVTIDDGPAGEYTLTAPATQTAAWPIGLLDVDVKYSDGTAVAYSETFHLSCQDHVTEV